MRLSNITRLLEELAPYDLAVDPDDGRIGLIVPGREKVSRVAVALDPTENAIREAIDQGADMLVVHHTLIYDPTSRISPGLARKLRLLLDNEMSLFCMHTNWDAAPGGVNDSLAEAIGLEDVEGEGLHRIGRITGMPAKEFAMHVSECLDTHVEVIGRGTVERVMVVSGSGFGEESMMEAKYLEADALVSGDLRHSSIVSREGLVLVDATHYATESPGMEKLAELLGRHVDTVYVEDPPEWSVIQRE